MNIEMVITLAKIIFMVLMFLSLVPVLIWLERKGCAYIQDRRGPNRANILGLRLGGLIHALADVVKLLTKEDFIPAAADRFYFILAPVIVMTIAVATLAIIPFADTLRVYGMEIPLQIADLNVGILYLFAIASLGIYGIVLGGWSSNNKYSLLGALRSAAQMISYEVSLGLAVIGLLMVFQGIQLNGIVQGQGELLWGFLPRWGVFVQPVGFLIFITALFAETNRNPFDLPEGESEIVGYHVEYSGMKFALFFMGEYVNIAVGSSIIATLFFGGWQVPYLPTHRLIEKANMLLPIALWAGSVILLLLGIRLVYSLLKKRVHYADLREYEPKVFAGLCLLIGICLAVFLLFGPGINLSENGAGIFAAAVQTGTFILKTLFFCWLFIWVRWTLPRFRYDQLMRLGWQALLPLALVNILITAVVLLYAGSG
jgi:NADH-quinone oxidoreductase subunit H